MRAAQRRCPHALAAFLALALLAVAGCGGCNRSAPSEGDAIPAGIRIPVDVDGTAAPPIDAAKLEAVRADFTDHERRAWRLRSLLGSAYDRPNGIVEIEDAEGGRLLIKPAESNEGREPVLAVNRIGEVRFALVRPDEPFPAFHGRGGNRGRAGDPTRIREVRHIALWLSDAGAP